MVIRILQRIEIMAQTIPPWAAWLAAAHHLDSDGVHGVAFGPQMRTDGRQKLAQLGPRCIVLNQQAPAVFVDRPGLDLRPQTGRQHGLDAAQVERRLPMHLQQTCQGGGLLDGRHDRGA